MSEPGKSEIVKQVQVASTVGVLSTSQEALWHSIDVLCACLNTYDLEVWSVLREWDTCMASVKELEEALVAEESMDKGRRCATMRKGVWQHDRKWSSRRTRMRVRAKMKVRVSQKRRTTSLYAALASWQRQRESISQSKPCLPHRVPLLLKYIVLYMLL